MRTIVFLLASLVSAGCGMPPPGGAPDAGGDLAELDLERADLARAPDLARPGPDLAGCAGNAEPADRPCCAGYAPQYTGARGTFCCAVLGGACSIGTTCCAAPDQDMMVGEGNRTECLAPAQGAPVVCCWPGLGPDGGALCN